MLEAVLTGIIQFDNEFLIPEPDAFIIERNDCTVHSVCCSDKPGLLALGEDTEDSRHAALIGEHGVPDSSWAGGEDMFLCLKACVHIVRTVQDLGLDFDLGGRWIQLRADSGD